MANERIMEGGGGAEVRRINLVYFLSRKGRVEQPHLIRVHHLSRNGVHLRDIKRWLADLRGKEMSESFAWSYKRKYKSGYVWQDLLDGDLITPISDNEYVLKGSEIASSTYTKEDSYNEKKDKSSNGEEEANEDSPKSPPLNKEEEEEEEESVKMEESNINPCEIEQESHSFGSEKSTLSDQYSLKVEEDQKHFSQEFKQEIHEESNPPTVNSSSTSSPSDKKKKKSASISMEKIDTPRRSCSSTSHNTTFSRSKSYSNGASSLFRNLITCGTVDTRDSATVINRKNKTSMNTNMSYGDHSFDQSSFDRSIELCKGDKLGGSQRVFATSLNQQPQFARKSCDGVRSSSSNSKTSEFTPKPNAAYKPINGPQCSQCGKQFKPEKLHAHMKSCKRLKAFTKSNSTVSAATTEKSSDKSAEFPMDNYSISGYYLTQRRG